MTKKKEEKKSINLLDYIFLLAPLFYGLFPIWSLCLFGAVCIGCILYKVNQNKRFLLPKGISIYLICFYLISFLIAEVSAIDKGMTLLAFFKNIPILLFIILCAQFEESDEEKQKHLYFTSISSSASVLLSLFLILFPGNEVFKNLRLQGLFFYANSYGLFLLVGLVYLYFKKDLKWYDYLMIATNIIGIVLTNSRAIIVLTFLFTLTSIFFNKEKWKSLLIIIFSFVIVFLISSNYMEKRVTPEMLQSSEFMSRLIYYQDAVKMIVNRPLGHGYEGFWYEQAKVQTGVYDSKFVHSSILQVGIDVGVLPIIALSALLIITFFDKKQTALSRILLILIIGHSIIDIDLEFIYFLLIILLFINYDTIPLDVNKLFKPLSYIAIILFLYVGFSDVEYNLGIFRSDYLKAHSSAENVKYDTSHFVTAIKMVPFYSDAIQEAMYNSTSSGDQLKYANLILKYNQNVSGAYEALENEALANKDYDKAIYYENERLLLNKYKISNYESYGGVLGLAYNYYVDTEELEKAKSCLEKIVDIENRINKVLEDTNPLAYKTIHPPELNIETSTLKNLIEKSKERLEKVG